MRGADAALRLLRELLREDASGHGIEDHVVGRPAVRAEDVVALVELHVLVSPVIGEGQLGAPDDAPVKLDAEEIRKGCRESSMSGGSSRTIASSVFTRPAAF
jgi:hypothetical protein